MAPTAREARETATDEIEVTPEMIEAGADALCRYDATTLPEPVVLDVYRVMAALDRSRAPRSS